MAGSPKPADTGAPGTPAGDADAARFHEQCTGGVTLLSGGWLDVRRDDVRLPDGSHATREYIVHPGAVAVVPILDDGRLVLVRQYRYPVAKVLLELPAGKVDAGEDILTCARRELREETGYTAAEWAYAGEIHNAAAYATESIHLYFARGLVAGATALDDGEIVETCILDEAALDALAGRNELPDVKTRIGLQWLQRWRAGAWLLQWERPAP